MMNGDMNCPACSRDLIEVQVGSVCVDICQGGCGGIWFDAFELQKVDEDHEQAGEHLLAIELDPNVVVDSTHRRSCPRCAGIKLQRHFFSAKRRVEVDQCPNCGGYWLDAGELTQIRAEQTQQESARHAARSGISSDVIRYLYRLQAESGRA